MEQTKDGKRVEVSSEMIANGFMLTLMIAGSVERTMFTSWEQAATRTLDILKGLVKLRLWTDGGRGYVERVEFRRLNAKTLAVEDSITLASTASIRDSLDKEAFSKERSWEGPISVVLHLAEENSQ